MNETTALSLRRATLHGYVAVLLGVLFGAFGAPSVLATGRSAADVGTVVLGVLAVRSGVRGYFRPEQYPRGSESAPTYLYVLAGVATVAFGFGMAALL